MDEITNGAIVGAIVIWVINKLRGSILKGLDEGRLQTVNKALAAFAAAISAAGLHFAFDQHAGILTISGLTWQTILPGLWMWIKQYAIQQGIWRGYKFATDSAMLPIQLNK